MVSPISKEVIVETREEAIYEMTASSWPLRSRYKLVNLEVNMYTSKFRWFIYVGVMVE